MISRSLVLLLSFGACLGARAANDPALLTYNTNPLGTAEAPLLLRTYVPDPDLDPAVFANHHHGGNSPRYSPETGLDLPGEYVPIKGIPAAIAVNHGPALSYVFDTTEGRLMYSWQGGFLDMFPYWGDQALGNRVGNDYLPRLVGTMFYKATGKHPLEINGRSVSELGKPKFVGYDLVKKQPVFIVRYGNATTRWSVQPLAGQLGLKLDISVEPAAPLAYRTEDPKLTVKQEKGANGTLHVTLTGESVASFSGYPRRINITAASVTAGEQLSKSYGCVVCHSTDGSGGHGPTWFGLFEKERPLADGRTVKADDAYLLESITNPNAKIAQTFAPNFMPVYTVLRPIEVESLILYIKSLKQPE